MSEAEMRNGARVVDAMVALVNRHPNPKIAIVTVGQVAEEAKMSKATAKKYLKALIDRNWAYEWRASKTAVFYGLLETV